MGHQLVRVRIKGRREKGGGFVRVSEEVIDVVNPCMTKAERDKFYEPAIEYLWHCISGEMEKEKQEVANQ